jgi:tRNA(Arg) A34 adenosine deaminase TadA
MADYRRASLYTTLSPCAMCAGAILHYQIPRCIIADSEHFQGEEVRATAGRESGRARCCARVGLLSRRRRFSGERSR